MTLREVVMNALSRHLHALKIGVRPRRARMARFRAPFRQGASAAKACAGAAPPESRAIGPDSSWLNGIALHGAWGSSRSFALSECGRCLPADMGRATMPGKRSGNGFCDPLSREGDARPETGREVPGPKPQQGLGQNPIGRWLVPEGDSKRNIHEM